MSEQDDEKNENDSYDSKRPRVAVANPYLKQKPVAVQPTETCVPVSLPVLEADGQSEAAIELRQSELPAQPPAAASLATFGDKDTAVERLPSRNVSFGSAEILTVTELHKHASLYVDQSVRVTGVVLHRQVADDGNVCLVLGDPLTTSGQRKPAPQSSILSSGGIKRRFVPKKSTSLTTSRLVTRKRPLPASGTSTGVPTKSPKDPVDAMLTTLVEHATILVFAQSQQVSVNDVVVGDLAMILGELRVSNAPAAVKPIFERWNQPSALTFVHARIARNVNGTDMRLASEALTLRRQHLIETCPKEEAGIRPGCGPPPYYTREDDKKQASV